MKYLSLLFLVLAQHCTLLLCAQDSTERAVRCKKHCITLGFFQAASLIGADFEYLFSKRCGLQASAGLRSVGVGIHYHLRPTVQSSSVSVQFWNLGMGKYFLQRCVGATYVIKGKRWLTGQFGVGWPIDFGPAFPRGQVLPKWVWMYSIGAYLPF